MMSTPIPHSYEAVWLNQAHTCVGLVYIRQPSPIRVHSLPLLVVRIYTHKVGDIVSMMSTPIPHSYEAVWLNQAHTCVGLVYIRQPSPIRVHSLPLLVVRIYTHKVGDIVSMMSTPIPHSYEAVWLNQAHTCVGLVYIRQPSPIRVHSLPLLVVRIYTHKVGDIVSMMSTPIPHSYEAVWLNQAHTCVGLVYIRQPSPIRVHSLPLLVVRIYVSLAL